MQIGGRRTACIGLSGRYKEPGDGSCPGIARLLYAFMAWPRPLATQVVRETPLDPDER